MLRAAVTVRVCYRRGTAADELTELQYTALHHNALHYTELATLQVRVLLCSALL